MNIWIAVIAVILACFEFDTRPRMILGDANSEALEAARPRQLPGSYG
jgi:hypothetical protein